MRVCAQKLSSCSTMTLCASSSPFLTPSCSSFIHTGVILSRKASIRFLDIVRAGAMNYLPVHVFVETFFFPCNRPPFHPYISSCQPQGRILTYPNCNITLREYYFPLTVDRFQKQESAVLHCRLQVRWLGGRAIVIAAHAVEEFTEVCQLIHHWSLSQKGKYSHHSPLCRCRRSPSAMVDCRRNSQKCFSHCMLFLCGTCGMFGKCPCKCNVLSEISGQIIFYLNDLQQNQMWTALLDNA